MPRRNQPVYPAEGLGGRIKVAREAMGWSQVELGRAIGVSKSAVSQWEKGVVQNLKLGNLFAAARVLNKDVRHLVFGEQSAATVADKLGPATEVTPQRLALLDTYDSLPKDVQAHVRWLIMTLAQTHGVRK